MSYITRAFCLRSAFWLLAALLLNVAAANAESMEFRGLPPQLPTVVAGNAWFVFGDGDIEPGSDEKLEAFLIANDVPRKSLLYLNSPGGNLLAGMKLGKVIRKFGLFTYIGKSAGGREPYKTLPGECYSACALAFLGGEYRFHQQNSEYGVHRFYSEETNAEGGDTAQILSAMVVQYIRDMGVSPELFSLMSRAGASELVRLNEAEMERLHVTNGGVQLTKWSIESRSGAVYLKGERETWRGINKFILICLPQGKIALNVMYDPEGREDTIVKALQAHSLFINGDPIPIGQNQIHETQVVNGWINADYLLTDELLSRIASARTVGIAMQASYGAPDFMGFEGMELADGRDKLMGFLNLCRGNRAQR